jgi:hypothetical protein
VEPLAGLVVYGPLGLWALAATAGVVHLYRDNGRLRDACAATTAALNEKSAADVAALNEKNAAAVAATAAAFAAQVQAMGTAHAQALREQADRYDRQASEMQQRTFAIVTTLSDKLSALADSFTRNRVPR